MNVLGLIMLSFRLIHMYKAGCIVLFSPSALASDDHCHFDCDGKCTASRVSKGEGCS